MDRLPFSEAEFAERISRTQASMEARGIEVLVVSNHANIYYLTGLWLNTNVFNALLVPVQGQPRLVVRYSDLLHVRASPRTPAYRVYHRGTDPMATVVDVLAELTVEKGTVGLEQNWLKVSEYQLLKNHFSEARLQDASTVLEELRVTKTPNEVVYVRKAAEAADAGMAALFERVAEGVNDAEFVSAFFEGALACGASLTTTEPLIRICRSDAPPRPSWWGADLRRGDVVFCEPGIRVGGYHAVLIRMLVVGEPSTQVKRLWDTVEGAYDAMLSVLKPGTDIRAVDAAGRQVVERNGFEDALLGRLGYGLGLSWPEPAGSIAPDEARVLEPGMIFHLQPYLDLVDHNLRFGLGNTVLVTEKGAEVLTESRGELYTV